MNGWNWTDDKPRLNWIRVETLHHSSTHSSKYGRHGKHAKNSRLQKTGVHNPAGGVTLTTCPFSGTVWDQWRHHGTANTNLPSLGPVTKPWRISACLRLNGSDNGAFGIHKKWWLQGCLRVSMCESCFLLLNAAWAPLHGLNLWEMFLVVSVFIVTFRRCQIVCCAVAVISNKPKKRRSKFYRYCKVSAVFFGLWLWFTDVFLAVYYDIKRQCFSDIYGNFFPCTLK